MKAIVNQTNIGTVSTAAALRKLPEDGIERIWTSPTLRYHPALFFIIVITIFITLLHGFGFLISVIGHGFLPGQKAFNSHP